MDSTMLTEKYTVSTHMPLARHDVDTRRYRYTIEKFLLTCLLRGMTRLEGNRYVHFQFLLTCLLRGMTQVGYSAAAHAKVSTHMPLARHDERGASGCSK